MQRRIPIRLSAAYVLAAITAPGAAADTDPAILLVTGISPHTAIAYNVVPIPLPPGYAFSIAGISAAGQVAGTTADASGNPYMELPLHARSRVQQWRPD